MWSKRKQSKTAEGMKQFHYYGHKSFPVILPGLRRLKKPWGLLSVFVTICWRFRQSCQPAADTQLLFCSCQLASIYLHSGLCSNRSSFIWSDFYTSVWQWSIWCSLSHLSAAETTGLTTLNQLPVHCCSVRVLLNSLSSFYFYYWLTK